MRLFTPSGPSTLLAACEIITLIARSALDLISYNLLYGSVQPARFISAHLSFFFFSFFFTSEITSTCQNYLCRSLSLRWEVQMILCREETNAVFLGLFKFPRRLT